MMLLLVYLMLQLGNFNAGGVAPQYDMYYGGRKLLVGLKLQTVLRTNIANYLNLGDYLQTG